MSKKILAIVLVALMVALLAPSLASAADVTLSLSKYTAGPGDTVIASGTADADTFVTIKGVSQFSDGSLGAVVLLTELNRTPRVTTAPPSECRMIQQQRFDHCRRLW